MGIELRDGGTYKNRQGDNVTVKAVEGDDAYPFMGCNEWLNKRFSLYGAFDKSKITHPFDLVEEVVSDNDIAAGVGTTEAARIIYEPEEFSIGSVVRLNSGGPDMTVSGFGQHDTTIIYCMWFASDCCRIEEEFRAATLQIISK